MKNSIFIFVILLSLNPNIKLKATNILEIGLINIPFWLAGNSHFIVQETKLIQSKVLIKEQIKFGISQVSVFPIPATNFIKIKTDDFNQYQLFDEKGVIYRKGWIDECETIERNSIPAGIYFLKLSNIMGDVYYHRVVFN